MSKHMLIADDSIVIQKAIGISFSQQDFTLEYAGNGEEAIQKAKAKKPDILIADTVMPKKNGYEVCDTFKKDPLLNSIPVLLLTGTHEPYDEVKGKNVGADGYILKPFESQALIDRVQQLLAKSHSTTLTMPRPIPPSTKISPPPPSPPVASPSPASTIAAGKPIVPSETVSIPPRYKESPALDLNVDLSSPPESSPPPSTASISQQEEVFDLSFDSSMMAMETPEPVDHNEKPTPVASDSLPAGEFWDFSADAKASPTSSTQEPEKISMELSPDDSSPPSSQAIDSSQPFSFEEEAVPSSQEIPFETSSFDLSSSPETPSLSSSSENKPFEIEEFPIGGTHFPKEKLKPSLSEPSSSSLALSEAQIEALVTKVFKGVIERIAWEVVPDLAETIIKEELKRLTQEKP